MTAKTVSERQRALREARAAAGLTEVRGIYARPEDHHRIKAYAAKLSKKRSASGLES
jgi:hypothetical protein